MTPDAALVKALADRPALFPRPKMPLACNGGGVAPALKQLTRRGFARLEGIARAPLMMAVRLARDE